MNSAATVDMSVHVTSRPNSQHRDSDPQVASPLPSRPLSANVSANAESIFAHPDVALMERKIWSLLYPKIEALVELSRDPTHILEVGGGTGHGAQIMRNKWGPERVGISVIDRNIPDCIKHAAATGVRWYQEELYSTTPGMMSALADLVVAARTFEYDPDYKRSLQHLRNLCSDNARVILVHNAEDSAALENVVNFTKRLEYLQEISCICIDAIKNRDVNCVHSYSETIDALRAKFAVHDGRDDSKQIEYHLGRAQQFGSDAAISFLVKSISLHQNTRDNIQNIYGDRIDQRRFWFSTSSDVHKLYNSLGYTLLSRSNFKETSSRLSVLVDELIAW